MLGRLPTTIRFCSRTCSTVARTAAPKQSTEQTLSLSVELREAKNLSMERMVEVFRAREKEFTSAHCLAMLVMMDSEASERAHSRQGYEYNMKAVRRLPETRRIVQKANEAAETLEPYMVENLKILTHAFTEEPEHPALVELEENVEQLHERQPLAKLLDDSASETLSVQELARLADQTTSLGAIDPNGLHKIVAAYARAGVHNMRLMRLIAKFAMCSPAQLSRENLLALFDQFDAIGYFDKMFILHVQRRLPTNPRVVEVGHEIAQHTHTMGVLTQWYRPWTRPTFGKPYAAPEWDTQIDNRTANYWLNKRMVPRRREENKERRLRGLPCIPPDGILCPWLHESFYGGGKKLYDKTPKTKLFKGYDPEA